MRSMCRQQEPEQMCTKWVRRVSCPELPQRARAISSYVIHPPHTEYPIAIEILSDVEPVRERLTLATRGKQLRTLLVGLQKVEFSDNTIDMDKSKLPRVHLT